MDPSAGWDLRTLLDVASKLSIITGLLLILVGGSRKLWVWGYQLREAEDRHAKREAELKEEVREWKELARRHELVTERSLALQEQQRRGGGV